MESLVAGEHRRRVLVASRLGVLAGEVLQPAQRGRRSASRRPLGRRALHHEPRLAQVVRPLAVDGRHGDHAARRDLQRVLGGEPAQGLAHRHVARAEPVRQGRDGQGLAGIEAARHQRPGEAPIDLVRERAPGRDGLERVFGTIGRNGTDCEAEETGWLHLADSPAALDALSARAEAWAALGRPVRILGAEAARALSGVRLCAGALLDESGGMPDRSPMRPQGLLGRPRA